MSGLPLGPHHATAVAVSEKAVLIMGASGSGKSTLALELLALGASLISDDQVVLKKQNGSVCVERPIEAVDAIEVRGIGIVNAPTIPSAPLALIVDMEKVEESRLPTPKSLEVDGMAIDLVYGKHISGLAQAVNLLVHNGRYA